MLNVLVPIQQSLVDLVNKTFGNVGMQNGAESPV